MAYEVLTYWIFYYLAWINMLTWAGSATVLLAHASKPGFWPRLRKHLQQRGVLYAFIVSLTAMCASLWLSNVALFRPCVLCWYQRIAMYPIVLLTGLSLWKKTPVRLYAMSLAGVGWVIAAYHYAIQRLSGFAAAVPCSANGECSIQYLNIFGFYSIPLFALCAFTAILVCLAYAKDKR